MNLRAKLGYFGAALTMVAALLVPFLLYGAISKGVASLGLHVDEIYSYSESWPLGYQRGRNFISAGGNFSRALRAPRRRIAR